MKLKKIQILQSIKEDEAPTNSASGIAGTGGPAGIGNQGEPPGPRGLLFRRKKIKIKG